VSDKEWQLDVKVISSDSTLTLIPHYVKVEQLVNESPWEAQVKWVEASVGDNSLLPSKHLCGCSLLVKASTVGAALKTIFYGRIYDCGSEYTGMYKEKDERYIKAMQGKELATNDYPEGKIPADTEQSQFLKVAQQASLSSLIVGYYIANYSMQEMPSVSGKRSYWNILEDIANNSGWFFYVDTEGTLRIFPRGHYISSKLLYPDFRARVTYNANYLVNSIEVWGKAIDQLLNDDVTTESLEGVTWYGNNIQQDSNVKRIGNYSIRGNYAGAIVMKASFDTALNLETGGRLHFRSRVLADYLTYQMKEHTLLVRFYSGGDYADSTIIVSGGKPLGTDQFGKYSYLCDWTEHYITFNLFAPESWRETSNFKWCSIDAIEFQYLGPLGDTDNKMWIDDLYFVDLCVKGSTVNLESVNKYGLRGKYLRDEMIPSSLHAQALANFICSQLDEPYLIVEDIEEEDIFDFQVGQEVTVSIYNTTLPGYITKITYEFDGKKLIPRIDVREKYVEDPEKLLQKSVSAMRKLGWDINAFYRMIGDLAVIDPGSDIVDINRVTHMFPYEEWDRVRVITITGEGGTGGWKKHDPSGVIEAWDFTTGHLRIRGRSSGGPYYEACIDNSLHLNIGTIWFRTRFEITEMAGYPELHFGIGNVGYNIDDDPGLGSRIAFYLDGPYLLTDVHTGSEVFQTEIATLNVGELYRLEWRCWNGSSIVYYVNRVPKATIYATLPALKKFFYYIYAGVSGRTIDFYTTELEFSSRS